VGSPSAAAPACEAWSWLKRSRSDMGLGGRRGSLGGRALAAGGSRACTAVPRSSPARWKWRRGAEGAGEAASDRSTRRSCFVITAEEAAKSRAARPI
jgi:hypothetical protein